MQPLLQSFIHVKDVSRLIEEYAQVNVPMAVQYIKERWIRWWHLINQNELVDVRDNNQNNCPFYAELQISKVNEWDGSIEGYMRGNLYRFPPPVTSFKNRLTNFQSSSVSLTLSLRNNFDFNVIVDNFKFKVKDEKLMLLDDFLIKSKDILLKEESDQIKRVCCKRFYLKEIEEKNELLIKRFQENRKGKVFSFKELNEPLLYGQHWFECQRDPIYYSVVGKEGKWSSLLEMMPTFSIILSLQIEHQNVEPLHFDGTGFSC
jgi:hypothetical protein